MSRKVASARSRCCKRFLLRDQRVLPVLALQLLGRRIHFGRRGFQILDEILEFLIRSRQLAAARTLRQRLRLFLQLRLHFGQEPSVLGGFILGVAAQLVPGGGDDFLLPLRNLAAVVASATAAPAALCCDCV